MNRSRFFAKLLGYADSCTDLVEFRLQILEDLQGSTGGNGALIRPGTCWAGSTSLYLDEGRRFTDLYVENAARFGPELQRWCALSRGSEAFIDSDVYDRRLQDRMGVYSEVIRPERVRSILACPLQVGGTVTGLIFLFRRGADARFHAELAAAATPLLNALALADRLLETAFTHGRPVTRARQAAPVQVAFEAMAPREQQVAALLACGLQNKEIAAVLGSSWHTVHAQAQRVFDKLGLHGRTQIALLAQRIGLAGRAPGADPALESFGALLHYRLSRRFGDHTPPSACSRTTSLEPLLPDAHHRLTILGAREQQVARLVAQGLTSRAIAALLGTSFHTVRAQTQRIFEKLGVRGRTSLALLLSLPGGSVAPETR